MTNRNSNHLDIKFKKMMEDYKEHKGSLIPALQTTQEVYGYLPKEAMEYISQVLEIPFSEVFGVATFYAQFRLQPRGKHVIKVCSGTACHVRGGPHILKEVEKQLHIKSGETTNDNKFSIEPVACLGACGLAPVMMIDEETFGRLTKERVHQILDSIE